MKYCKPEIKAMAPAVAAIQSDTKKSIRVTLDSNNQLAQNFAYEADE